MNNYLSDEEKRELYEQGEYEYGQDEGCLHNILYALIAIIIFFTLGFACRG